MDVTKKINNVYYQIKDTNKPLKLIAVESGFCQFVQFRGFLPETFWGTPHFYYEKTII